MENNKTIFFFDKESDKVKNDHLFLCNYFPSPFKADDDYLYPTVEHYYHVKIYFIKNRIICITGP